MPKIELQYLFINKSEQTSDECITILGNWFQEKITEGNTFTYTISGKEYIFRYSENIIGGACYLKLTYSCGRTSKLILSNLESLDIKIKEVSGRNGYSSITLVDSLSTSYSKQLSPLFTEYELELRKLVYLIIPPMMTKNWVDTFSEELIANVKKITKNGFKSEEILEHITLYDFEDYLFNKNYIDLKSNNAEVTPCKFNEISHEKLIEIIVGSEYDVSVCGKINLHTIAAQKYITPQAA